MKKRIAFLSIALATLAFASCSKKDAASLAELNGDWKLVSGTTTSISKSFDDDNDLTQTTTTTLTYDGEKCEGEQEVNYEDDFMDDQTNSIEQNITIEMSFDKKAGTYVSTVVTSETDNSEGVMYYIADPDVQGSYISQEFDVVYAYTSTEVESGDFFVNQASGEIAKGSQVNMAATKTETTTAYTKKFYKTGQSSEFTQSVYELDYWTDTYTMVERENTAIETDITADYSSAEVMTVVEATKTSLTITSNDSYSSITEVGIIESDKYESSSKNEFTFEKK